MNLLEYMTFLEGPSRFFVRDWEIDCEYRPLGYRQFGHDTNELGQMIYLLSSETFLYDENGSIVGKSFKKDANPSVEIKLKPGISLSEPAGRYSVYSEQAEVFPYTIVVDIEKLENGCRIRSCMTGSPDGCEDTQDVSIIRHPDRMKFIFEDQLAQDVGVWRTIPGMPTVYEKRISETVVSSAVASQAFDYGLFDYYTRLLTFIFHM